MPDRAGVKDTKACRRCRRFLRGSRRIDRRSDPSCESNPPAEAGGFAVLQFAFGCSQSAGGGPGAKPHCTRGMKVSSSSDPLFIARRLLMNTSGYRPVGGVRIPMNFATSDTKEMQL